MSKRSRKTRTSDQNRVEAQIKQAFRLTTTGSAVEIHVIRGERSFGTLNIGKGGVVWHPAYAKKSVRLSWDRFAERLENRRRGPAIEAPPVF